MARMPQPRPARTPRRAPTLLRRVLAPTAPAALALVAALGGCVGGGGAFGPGDPLTEQADCARRGVPIPAAVPREFAKTLLPDYRFAPGDTVLVEAARFDAPLRFPADQTVAPDGTIDLGRFGRPAVAGLTPEAVEALVDRRVDLVLAQNPVGADGAELDVEELRADGLLEVNVRLIDPAGSVYYVLGAVAAPGVYPLAGRETVLDAILTAGGLADNAKRCDIVLTRPSVPHDCRTVLPVCYDNLVQTGDSATNYQILPGDRIFVPAKGCKDAMAGLFGCGKGCELCRCGPQHGCGPDAKPCPTPVRYVEGCRDPAGMTGIEFLGLPGTEEDGTVPSYPDAIPAPAPTPAGTTGEDDGTDDGPAAAPAPPELPADEGDTDATEESAGADGGDSNADAGDTAAGAEPAPVPDVPDVPDLPSLDDLRASTRNGARPAAGRAVVDFAALPPAPRFHAIVPAAATATPARVVPAAAVKNTAVEPATAAGALPTLSAEGV